ncbi:MAG: YihY/virulence factor BrkB family protein [Octadecabacter sp.]
MRAWRFGRALMDAAGEQNVGLISAGIAFYGLFAVFPAMAALIAIFGLIADPSVAYAQLEMLAEFMPAGAYALIEAQLLSLLSAPSQALGWATLLSLGIALWSARAGVAALVLGLNAIYGTPNRGGARHIMVAMLLTLSLIGMAVIALFTVVIAPIAIALLPLQTETEQLLELIRWIVAITTLLAALGLLYRYGPNRSGARMSWLTPGALLVVLAWFAASAGFSVYVANFGSYNEVYGSIGAVIALLMWLYISAYLILLGAVMNVALERTSRKSAPKDT